MSPTTASTSPQIPAVEENYDFKLLELDLAEGQGICRNCGKDRRLKGFICRPCKKKIKGKNVRPLPRLGVYDPRS